MRGRDRVVPAARLALRPERRRQGAARLPGALGKEDQGGRRLGVRRAMKKIPYVQVFERTRVLGSVVAPKDMQFVTEPPMGMKAAPVILHISCQVHNVPHIPHLAQKVLGALGVEFTTLGGPENCCGAFHWHFGDEAMERQVANISLTAFQRIKAQTVLSLCPDCDY